jgi:glycine betaine/proline transport system permease protein
VSAAAAVGDRLGMPRVPRLAWAAALGLFVAVAFVVFNGQYTIPHDDDAPLFHALRDARDWVDANRNTNPILVLTVTPIRVIVTAVFDAFTFVLRGLTWPGLTVIGAALGLAVGGWRMCLLMAAGFLSFGFLGLWEHSVDTLALTGASVVLSLAVGIPLGILAGRNDRVMNLVRPVLDVMQIMPTFAYLAPMTLLFLIGPASAAIATMIYAIPPAVRITALGIRGVPPASVEAATSLGATGRQLLRKVQLPMARRTIILGINQTIMFALSMVVITALIDAPGLGKDILHALQQQDVGEAFDAGLAIVIMAIMLDRLTTQASERLDPAHSQQAPIGFAQRPWLRWGYVAVPIAAVVLGMATVGSSKFPTDISFSFRGPINAIVDWVSLNLFFITDWVKDQVTIVLINPLEGFFTSSPWWLIGILVVGIAVLTSGRRQAIFAAICLLGLLGLQVWEHSMQTLTQVLVAGIITLGVGVTLGVVSSRSDTFSRVLRPVLDFAQTMPAFVYLIPAIALFGPTRFTAVVAAVIYAVPPVVRLTEVGLRTVPAAPREAAISQGATKRQLLWKVELPLARPALLVATNQGIILVLAMVVVGGLVGGGALGYDVVAGFARRDYFGEGLAAAIGIVVLGIMLDRITQAAGAERRAQRDELMPAGRATPATPHG